MNVKVIVRVFLRCSLRATDEFACGGDCFVQRISGRVRGTRAGSRVSIGRVN